MKVPFLDLKAQYPLILLGIKERFARIIDNTAFVCGKEVQEFEKKFAELHDVKYCVGLSSGTAGNHLALLCNGIGREDEIIVPVNTFVAAIEAICYAGAVPVFVDVDINTFNIDVEKIEERITDKTEAINPVHLYGQPADMNSILRIADEYELKVIEDAAQAHCAVHKGRKVGGIGDVASWSFYPGKNLGAWGEAGAITTNDKEIYLKAKMLRDHGSSKKYYHNMIGFNYRMSEFQAAVLNVKMKYIEEWTDMRQENARRYCDGLKDIETIILPSEMNDVEHVYHLYVIRTKERNILQEYLKENDIASGLHYPFPLHMLQAYADFGYKRGDFPVAEQLASEILSLPMFAELSKNQIEYVCRKIKDI